MPHKTLCHRKLRRYRIKASLTQEDLAYEMNVSRQAVTEWERLGLPEKFSESDTKQLADALGIEPYKLEKSTMHQIKELGVGIIAERLESLEVEDKELVQIMRVVVSDDTKEDTAADAAVSEKSQELQDKIFELVVKPNSPDAD